MAAHRPDRDGGRDRASARSSPTCRAHTTRWPYAVLGGGYGLLGVALILYGLRRRAEVDQAIRAGAYAAPGDRALALIGAAAVVLALATGVVVVVDS